jgi:peptidoglycan hydrolase-like protein with peptidoglycan-binding domain
MGSLYLDQLPTVLHANGAGVPFIEVAGWQRRARSSGGYNGRIEGISIHHTASGPASDGWPSVNYGTFKAPARPIANIYVERSGLWWIAAGGATNTSGAGGPTPYLPVDGANSRTIGIEIMNDGVGEPYTDAQVMTVLHGVSLLWNDLAPRYGWGFQSDRIFGHFEWAPTRKCDPTGVSLWTTPENTAGCNRGPRWYMDQFRHSVIAHALDLVLPPPPPAWPWPLTLAQMQSIRAEPNKPTIQVWSSNFLVTYLQILLVDMTGASIEVTGNFDAGTDTAVRNFQAYLGLHVDGVVGPITWNCVDAFLADPFIAKNGG